MKQVHLNSLVKVKLTDLGVAILRHEFDESRMRCKSLRQIEFDSVYHINDGYIEMTLWEVMHKFGEYMGMGAQEYPIEDLLIYVKDEDIKEWRTQ